MKRLWLLIAVAGLLLASSLALAQSGGGYDLSWSTVDGGGGGSSTGGGYALGGGFWGGGAVAAPENVIYLPMVERNYR